MDFLGDFCVCGVVEGSGACARGDDGLREGAGAVVYLFFLGS